MARRRQNKGFGANCAGVLIASLIIAAASAQEKPPPAPPSAQPPYSPECQSGTTEIVAATPLPHVAAALQKRKSVRILAIGAWVDDVRAAIRTALSACSSRRSRGSTS
jgi:hypothetical protein